MKWPITTIGLDADDTLWHNENLFEDHHRKYCELLSDYHDPKTVERVLYETEMNNLELFGYGVKGFTLSCIETAISLTDGAIKAEEIRRIIDHCRQMLLHPVELLEGVESVLQGLDQRFRLLLITKGDLRDQERKIAKSGIAHHFSHTEVVSDKTVEAYARVLQRNKIHSEQFLMVGNSLKSDILPVLDLGGHGVHIPYRITWEHENVQSPPHDHDNFYQLESIQQLPDLIDAIVLGNNP
ncbi:MAG: HAD family hydrolase [Opitutales bacterium]|jgi:putative hydrolase of the HAD superfamily|nr:HAD family hydrolase [Opitutales bacterium]MDG2254590.1 HAD family hydrolase [Opitutaceae bacterium]MBT5169948.1 HAD family hydrolase [Opitutales bacterium]MBT5814059.1 HAD family hydrolase [Opitutales bacterium]MBT6768180.1 HAD family hydrolase [Opitutales bacterium]